MLLAHNVSPIMTPCNLLDECGLFLLSFAYISIQQYVLNKYYQVNVFVYVYVYVCITCEM